MWICLMCLCLGALAQTAQPPPFPLADIPLKRAAGPKVDLKQYRGKPLVVLMISLTCDHCVNAARIFNELQKQYGPQGLQVVGVAAGPNASYDSAGWGKHFAPAILFGYLEQADFLKLAGVPPNARPYVPIVLFVDPEGTVRRRIYGNAKLMKADMHDLLTDATKDLLGQAMPYIRR
jgi:thiol-disulfide isomerase/thioredoxin